MLGAHPALRLSALQTARRFTRRHLREALESVVKKNDFRKARYEVKPGTDSGDNYCSVLHRVEVSEDEGSSKKLSVMMKSQVASAAVRSSMKLYRAFANEAACYSELLPAYAEMLREQGLLEEGAGYPDAPRCLFASVGRGVDEEKDVLILQDMRPEGFTMLDRLQGVDLPHCRLVLRALADLHAGSFALECRQPQRFHSIKDSLIGMLQDEVEAAIMLEKVDLTKNALEMIEKRFPEGSRVYERTRDYCNTVTQDIAEVFLPLPEGGNVICHGDCWTNNLLFKYSESGQVERVCFLDFQFARYASPVLDLMFFLYMCTDRSLRAAHLDSLLQEYHARLQARMRALGVPDPDAVFSWQRLESHLRQRARYGMFTAVFFMPVFTATKKDAPDLGAQLESGAAIGEAFLVKAKDTAERDRRVSDVAEEMVEKDYI